VIENAWFVLRYLYPNADDLHDYRLEKNSETGDLFISVWDEAKLGKQPTIEFIASKEAEALAVRNARWQTQAIDRLEMERLKALPRKDWQAADVKIAVQIWVSRE